jgi:hypothetical protein
VEVTCFRRRSALVAVTLAATACVSVLGVDDVAYYLPVDAGTPVDDGGPEAREEDADAGRGALYRNAVMQDRPLAYWRLDDTGPGVCANEIGSDYVAACPSSATYGAPGLMAGRAVRFGANGISVVAEAGVPLDFPHHLPFAFEAWVALDSLDGGTGSVLRKLALDPPNGYVPALGVTLFLVSSAAPDGASSYGVRWERWANDALWLFAMSNGLPEPLATYHHVVVTRDAIAETLYVDLATPDVHVADPDADPGANDDVFNWGPLNGTLDEVAIYDHALPPERVRAHFLAGTAP